MRAINSLSQAWNYQPVLWQNVTYSMQLTIFLDEPARPHFAVADNCRREADSHNSWDLPWALHMDTIRFATLGAWIS
jgi:hypothetical protein